MADTSLRDMLVLNSIMNRQHTNQIPYQMPILHTLLIVLIIWYLLTEKRTKREGFTHQQTPTRKQPPVRYHFDEKMLSPY